MTEHALQMDAERAASFDHDDIRARLGEIADEQTRIFKGDDMAGLVASVWAALIARQHVLLVGPPGVAKTMVIEDFASRITNARYFSTQLFPGSEPSSLVGPVDLEALRNGHHSYRIDGMLPDAHIAFVGEVLNGTHACLEMLHSIMNERTFHMDGRVIQVPLWTMFMDTNRLSESERLAGWWDRVHHRHMINPITDRDDLEEMVFDSVDRARTGGYEVGASLTLTELMAAHYTALSLPISDTAKSAALDTYEELHNEAVVISPRRLNSAIQAAMANAYINGHDQVQVSDLSILSHMLWTSETERHSVNRVVESTIEGISAEGLGVFEDLQRLREEFEQFKNNIGESDDLSVRLQASDLHTQAIELYSQAQDEAMSKQSRDHLVEQISELSNAISEYSDYDFTV